MTLFDPLAESADRRRYVPLDTSERALAALAASLREGRSPVLLTGPSGIGKTLMLHVLAERQHNRLQRVRFSDSLEPAPDELAGWLLHCLFRQEAPEGDDAEDALFERLHGFGEERRLLLVDQIHRAPPESVRKLAELARAGAPALAVVVAGIDGADLRERVAGLAPEATVSLPDSLPGVEIWTLYGTILANPGLSHRLRNRLASVDRSEILSAASGLPLLLKQDLLRREERAAAPAPQFRRVEPQPSSPRALPVPAAAAGSAVQIEPRDRCPSRVGLLRDAVRPWGHTFQRAARQLRAQLATNAMRARQAAMILPRGLGALASRSKTWISSLAVVVAALLTSLMQSVRAGTEALRAFIAIVQGGVVRRYARLAASAARAALAARARLLGARDQWTLLLAKIGGASRTVGASIRLTSMALSRSLRSGAHRSSAVLRAAVRRAVPGAAVGVTALFVVALLQRIPAVSSSTPARLPDAPAGIAIPRSPSGVNVQVNARPWAHVRIGGRDLGPTPFSQRFAPGIYELEASFPDGRTIHRSIEVSPERRFVSLP